MRRPRSRYEALAHLFVEEVGPALLKLELIQESTARLHDKYYQEAAQTQAAWARATDQIIQSFQRTKEEMKQVDEELVRATGHVINTALEQVLVELYSVPVHLLKGESGDDLRRELRLIADESSRTIVATDRDILNAMEKERIHFRKHFGRQLTLVVLAVATTYWSSWILGRWIDQTWPPASPPEVTTLQVGRTFQWVWPKLDGATQAKINTLIQSSTILP